MIPGAALAARVPWLKVAKWGGIVFAVVLVIGAGLWARGVIERTRLERDQAVADVADFRRIVTDATVPPGAKGERPLLSTADAKGALAGAIRDRDDARVTLARVDRETKAAKVRADRADANLAQTQAANLRRLGAAQTRIDELERGRSSASAAENEAAIEDDSRAAWEAWR